MEISKSTTKCKYSIYRDSQHILAKVLTPRHKKDYPVQIKLHVRMFVIHMINRSYEWKMEISALHFETRGKIPISVGIYMFKVNNRNTRKKCEICSKLTIKTPQRLHWRRSGVFIVNFQHISHLVLLFLL